MRTMIIGDIHGCIEEFEALLQILNPQREDRVILLGDLFDRGPSSWEVFQKVKQLQREYGDHFVLLRGNHDDYLMTRNMSPFLRSVWESVGRQTTVNSFHAHGERMQDAADWLREHCVLYWKEDRFQCVHAGVQKEPIEENDIDLLINDHEIVLENTYQGKLTITGHIALEMPVWFKGDGEYEILNYHREYPLPDYGVICVDTGCGKGGILSGMVIENDRFILCYA